MGIAAAMKAMHHEWIREMELPLTSVSGGTVVGIPLFAVAPEVLHLGVLLLTEHGIEEYRYDISNQWHEERQTTGAAHAEKNKEDQDDGIHFAISLV